MTSLWHFLAVAAVLFGVGLVGFLTRRNLITMFLSAELMLQGVVLNMLAFSKFHANMSGQVFALFVLTVAACEAGIAMALFISLYRRNRSLDVSLWQDLRETGVPETVDAEPLAPAAPGPEVHEPRLATAGRRPVVVTTSEGAPRV
ncbi:MAG: NADH-quinone oxidoreductase subunit NuoK [Gemmataceae bacterium]